MSSARPPGGPRGATGFDPFRADAPAFGSVTGSLRRRLPILISALLCLVVSALCWSAYRALENGLLLTASERVSSASQQLGQMLGEWTRRLVRDGRTLAADSTIVVALERGDAPSVERARITLERQAARAPQTLRLALSGPGGQPMLAVGPLAQAADAAGPAGSSATPSVPREGGPTRPPLPADSGVGPLTAVDGMVAYPVTSVVRDRAGAVIGTIVELRRLSLTGGRQGFGALIGANTQLGLGNADGSLWTDLVRPVPPPAGELRPGQPVSYRSAAGEHVLGAARSVTGTPWAVLVEMPRGAILAPAHQFLIRVVSVALVVVVLGAVGAWVVSRQVTTPLGEVSRAAADLADGDYGRRVRVQGRDELASLAMSFNSMAEQVEAAALDLQTRAHQLESTNLELRESEVRYRRLVELAPYGMLVHDGDVVLFVNPTAAALLGAAEPGQVTGRRVLDFVHPQSREAAVERVARNIADRAATSRTEIKLMRLDGTSIDVETAGIPFAYRGRPAAQVVLRDVGEHKRLEAQFRQAQKMEAVGQLAGGVAHDFNNLLTVITSYSGMLLAALPPTSAERADVLEIERAAHRAAGLTRQLLAFSRQQVLQPRVLDLNTVARDMEKLLARLVREDVRVATILAPRLGAVYADAGQIEQVIMNLVVNARDALPMGGTVTIETANVHHDGAVGAMPDEMPAGPYVMLAVSDTGLGMDAETQSRIFEPFFTTKRLGEGTGLGLSTVYGIVRQSGGYVAVESERGVGTTFRVYLPRATHDVVAPRTAGAHTALAAGTETILLAEDEASVRAVARRILERSGYRVVDVANGAEALRVCEDSSCAIDLLITDIIMPEMNGRELVEHARALRPEMPVLFMSGYTDDAIGCQSFFGPDTLYLQKPFTPDALTSQVRQALRDA